VATNAVRNDKILNALENDIPFLTAIRQREGRAASVEIHRNRFTIPNTASVKFKRDTVRISYELKDVGVIHPNRATKKAITGKR
jgi:hypothetical protein